MKKLLLFDIDGTLISLGGGISNRLFIRAMEDVYNINLKNVIMPKFGGNTDLGIIKDICNSVSYDFEKITEKINEFWQTKARLFKDYCNKQYVDLLPGVSELLNYLKDSEKYELALVTGNSKINAYQKLKSHDVDIYFKTGAFGSDHHDRKYLPPLAIERTNEIGSTLFSKDDTIIIGDTSGDVYCAKENNIKIIAVTTGSSDKEELLELKPDAILDDFSEIGKFEETLKNIH